MIHQRKSPWPPHRLQRTLTLSPPPPHSPQTPPSPPLSAERVLGQAVLVRPLQSHEPHAVHRLRRPGARQHVRPVDHHAEHDRRSHLLRHVRGPRHGAHPVAGLVASPVPREGESEKKKGINKRSTKWTRIDVIRRFIR